jgi:co-chaperonin GroES (HSP10)
VTTTGSGTVTYESTVTLQTGASIAFTSSQHLAGLTVGSGATATLATGASGTRVLETDNLSINTSGGKVDLKDNKMIFRNQGTGAWNGSNYAGVSGLIKSGRNNGGWNGSGLVTSMSAAASPSFLTTLAVATAGEAGKTTFNGVSVASGDTLVMYTYAGDANLSGAINADDYFQIDSHYGKTANSAKSYFNGDDYMLIDASFAFHGTPFSSAAPSGLAASVSAVPEPAALGVVALFAMGSFARRHRRR